MSTYTTGKKFNVTTGVMGTDGSTVAGFPAWGGVSVDNVRRTFAIGDYVSQLAPEQSLFFAYLSKVAKSGLDETVWKPMEYRPQWQRRNFTLKSSDNSNVDLTKEAGGGVGAAKKLTLDSAGTESADTARPYCNYNNVGKKTADWSEDPIFMLPKQVIRVPIISSGDTSLTHANFKITGINSTTGTLALESVRQDFTDADTYVIDVYASASDAPECQIVGSAFAEASTAPDGWSDQLSTTEFYMQIFKTAVPLMSGSAQATKYRGFADEYSRIYTQHVLSHKMDIENAMLFGQGSYVSQDERYTWGIVPFIETQGGKAYAVDATVDGFDYFVDLMRDFFDYESGNSGQKLVLTSRAVIAWLTKMGSASSAAFIHNTLSMGQGTPGAAVAGPYSASIDVKQSKFAPVPITAVSTAFGTMNFVAHPLFRGHAENLAAVIDMNNVSYKCLQGNGINRDTFVETNIQDNSVDGRKDQIITECGLEVKLPETHALLKFSGLTSNLAI